MPENVHIMPQGGGRIDVVQACDVAQGGGMVHCPHVMVDNYEKSAGAEGPCGIWRSDGQSYGQKKVVKNGCFWAFSGFFSLCGRKKALFSVTLPGAGDRQNFFQKMSSQKNVLGIVRGSV